MKLARLARWCYRRRRLVVVLWIVGFIVMNAVGGAIGSAYSDNFSGGHSDSIAAFDLLKSRFPARAGDTADIVFSSENGDELGEASVDYGQDQFEPVGEVVVDAALGPARDPRHRLGGQPGDALTLENLLGRGDEPLTGLGRR